MEDLGSEENSLLFDVMRRYEMGGEEKGRVGVVSWRSGIQKETEKGKNHFFKAELVLSIHEKSLDRSCGCNDGQNGHDRAEVV